MKKISLFVSVALVCTTVLLAGCNKKTEAKYHIDLGQLVSIMLNPSISLAESNGYFKENGVEVSYKPIQYSSAEALAAGKLDAMTTGLTQPLVTGGQGGNVTIFAGSQYGGFILVARKDEVENLRDTANWKNKRIGVRINQNSEIFMRSYLRDHNALECDRDYSFTYFDDNVPILTGVLKNNIDIGGVSPEFGETARQQGLEIIFPITHLVPENVCCRQFANREFFEKNHDAFKAYLKAQIKAYKDFKTKIPESVAALAAWTGQDEQYIRDFVYDREKNGDRGYNPDPNYNGTLDFYNVMREVLHDDLTIPLYEFFDISLYADALKAVIKENPKDEFYKEMWEFFVKSNNRYPNFEKNYL